MLFMHLILHLIRTKEIRTEAIALMLVDERDTYQNNRLYNL